MNLGKAFTYPFEDKSWTTKLGLAIVITIVPILNFATVGYVIEIIRRVLRDDPELLPDWTDLGQKFLDGLIIFLASLVYSLPFLILIFPPVILMMVPAVLAGNSNTQNIGQALSSAALVGLACLGCVGMLYGLALSLVFPCGYLTFARQGKFSDFFRLREFLAMIGRDPGAFFTAWGIYLAAVIATSLVSGVLGGLLGWIPCFGQLVSFVIGVGGGIYVLLVFANLFGQFGLIQRSAASQA
jgi:hypothetical protein